MRQDHSEIWATNVGNMTPREWLLMMSIDVGRAAFLIDDDQIEADVASYCDDMRRGNGWKISADEESVLVSVLETERDELKREAGEEV